MAVTINRGSKRYTSILGVDSSTKLGWSHHNVGRNPKDSHVCSGEMYFKDLKGLARLHAFSNTFGALLDNVQPDVIMMEGYGYSNAHTLVILVEVGTVVQMAAYTRNIPIFMVAPTSLKKFVLGVGKGKKDVMMLGAYKTWGIEGTDNEVDAFCLAKFGMATVIDLGLPKANMAAISSWISKHREDCNKLHNLLDKL